MREKVHSRCPLSRVSSPESARASADFIERNSTRDLGAALSEYDWVDLRIDGLQVFMTGTAPDEVQRFRARAKAETVVDAGRIIDDKGAGPTPQWH